MTEKSSLQQTWEALKWKVSGIPTPQEEDYRNCEQLSKATGLPWKPSYAQEDFSNAKGTITYVVKFGNGKQAGVAAEKLNMAIHGWPVGMVHLCGIDSTISIDKSEFDLTAMKAGYIPALRSGRPYTAYATASASDKRPLEERFANPPAFKSPW